MKSAAKNNALENRHDLCRNEFEEMSGIVRNTRVSVNLKSEKLAYILEMLKELRQLSSSIDERMIAYLIEMAVLETSTAINVIDFGVDPEKEKRGFEAKGSSGSG